jgi:hypothetical protein
MEIIRSFWGKEHNSKELVSCRTEIMKNFIGSVAEKVLRGAKCHCLLVKA